MQFSRWSPEALHLVCGLFVGLFFFVVWWVWFYDVGWVGVCILFFCLRRRLLIAIGGAVLFLVLRCFWFFGGFSYGFGVLFLLS